MMWTDALKECALSYIDPQALNALTPEKTNECNQFIESLNHSLNQEFKNNPDLASELIQIKAYSMNLFIAHLWNHFRLGEFNLVAIGGFGRGELHPYSDIDLMILTPTGCEKEMSQVAKFHQFLWDLGLQPGVNVGTPEQILKLAKEEITVMTSLLESRCMSESKGLYQELKRLLLTNDIWPSSQFFSEKLEEQNLRHLKCGGTAYNLEPNIKEGPGGMRDIHMIQWVALRHFGEQPLARLVDHQLLTQQDVLRLNKGITFLSKVRFALHQIAGRKEERLLFNHQKSVANSLGFKELSGKNSDIEAFMQVYYKQVMALERLNDRVLQIFEENILLHEPVELPYSEDFNLINHRLELTDPSELYNDPKKCFSAILELQRNSDILGFRGNTIKALRQFATQIGPEFRNNASVKQQFLQFFKQDQRIFEALNWLNRLEILPNYLPDFAIIVGRMQFDLFHSYTVDQHTLFVVRNLENLRIGVQNIPLAIKVFSQIKSPHLLYLAGFFHDIAKGRGGSHASKGAEIATQFGHDHNMPDAETELISWLVQNHLIMSVTAQKKDIHNPKIIEEFCQKVNSAEKLQYLYLLTIADITATNITLWNGFKETLLRELYFSAMRFLSPAVEDSDEQLKATLIKSLSKTHDSEAASDAVSQISMESLRRYSPDNLEEMLGFTLSQRPPVVEVLNTTKNSLEIFVYSEDFRGLFYTIVSVFEKHNYNIVDAKISNTTNGYAFNTFHCLTDHTHLAIDHLLNEIKQKLSAKTLKINSIRRRQNVRELNFPVETRFIHHPSEKPDQSKIEIICTDKPGLLALIAEILLKSDLEINAAKIVTFGTRAEDTFWISSNGKALTQEQINNLQTKTLHKL